MAAANKKKKGEIGELQDSLASNQLSAKKTAVRKVIKIIKASFCLCLLTRIKTPKRSIFNIALID